MKPYYQDDFATIYHGDNLDFILNLERASLILTDPPYGLANKLSGGTWGAKHAGGLEWDAKAANLDNILPLADDAIIWGGNYFALPASRCWLVWRKPDRVRTMADVDLAWTSFDLPSRCLTYSIAATNGERNGHPTQKPLAVMLWCLSLTPDAQTILDPFMGSGTTLVAAKQLGRKAIGIELEEKYCEIAAKRLAQEYLPFRSEPLVTHTQEIFAEV